MYRSAFPSPENADEDGIVALSHEINCELLADAYYHGIFPWPWGGEEKIIPWCAPLMRGVIMVDEFHIPDSFMREMKKMQFSFRVNCNFSEVIRSCAVVKRKGQCGTWITPELIKTYCRFHELGFAHSFEAYDADGSLAGGLYGISLGRVFCGESMFFKVSGASKFAFVKTVELLKSKGVVLIDTQMITNLTAAFGAKEIPSAKYIALLEKYRGCPLAF